MIVFVLTACPVGLRGHLSRWLSEVSPGVFVGVVNARLREALWNLVVAEVREGRALAVFEDHSVEQGFIFRTHRSSWVPRDFDGLSVLFRPSDVAAGELRSGWSVASRLRRKRS